MIGLRHGLVNGTMIQLMEEVRNTKDSWSLKVVVYRIASEAPNTEIFHLKALFTV